MKLSPRLRAVVAASALLVLLAGCCMGGMGIAILDRTAGRPVAGPAGDAAAARDDGLPPAGNDRPRIFNSPDAAWRHAVERAAR